MDALCDVRRGLPRLWAEGGQSALLFLEDAAAGLRGIDDGFAARALVFAGGLADDLDQPEASLADVRTAIELAELADDANLLVTRRWGSAACSPNAGTPRRSTGLDAPWTSAPSAARPTNSRPLSRPRR